MALDRFGTYQRQREALIAQHGWMVQGVFPTAEIPGSSFSYTIGLTDRDLPELIQIGLPIEVGHTLLNDTAALLQAQPDLLSTLPLEYRHPNWPAPFTLVNADAFKASDWAVQAWRRSHQTARFVQVVWPDKHGHWPWELECSEGVRTMQPLLTWPNPAQAS